MFLFPALARQMRCYDRYCRFMVPQSTGRASAISPFVETGLRGAAAMTSFTISGIRAHVTFNFRSAGGPGMVDVGAAAPAKAGLDMALPDCWQAFGGGAVWLTITDK
jgi:hypothetical protein